MLEDQLEATSLPTLLSITVGLRKLGKETEEEEEDEEEEEEEEEDDDDDDDDDDEKEEDEDDDDDDDDDDDMAISPSASLCTFIIGGKYDASVASLFVSTTIASVMVLVVVGGC